MAIRINGDNTTASPGITGTDTDTGLQFGTDEIQLVTGGTSRATVESNGNFTIENGNLVVASGRGIDFSADASATGMASELLDDYEQGTWTPAIYGSTTNPTYSASVAVGDYTKVGNLCTVSFLIIVTGTPSGGSGNWWIGAVPFAAASQSSYSNVGVIGYNDVLSSGVDKCYIGGTNILLIPNGTTQGNLTFSNASITSGYLAGTITYRTA